MNVNQHNNDPKFDDRHVQYLYLSPKGFLQVPIRQPKG